MNHWLDAIWTPNELMFIILSVIMIVCSVYLYRLNADKKSKVYFLDLVCTNGVLNERKFSRFGVWIVSTWGFIYLIAMDRLTEWYFIGYMGAWVANALIGKAIQNKDLQEYYNEPNNEIREKCHD
jgi:hypothetical protein